MKRSGVRDPSISSDYHQYNIGAVRHDNLLVVHVAKMFFLELSSLKSKYKEEKKFNIRPNMIYLTVKSVLQQPLSVTDEDIWYTYYIIHSD